jgi:hypothetical protein
MPRLVFSKEESDWLRLRFDCAEYRGLKGECHATEYARGLAKAFVAKWGPGDALPGSNITDSDRVKNRKIVST